MAEPKVVRQFIESKEFSKFMIMNLQYSAEISCAAEPAPACLSVYHEGKKLPAFFAGSFFNYRKLRSL